MQAKKRAALGLTETVEVLVDDAYELDYLPSSRSELLALPWALGE